MKKLFKEDISGAYFEHRLGFRELDYYDENDYDNYLKNIDNTPKNSKPLLIQELIDEYDMSPDVATKLVGYQKRLLADYRNTVEEFLSNVDRYIEIKPYVENGKLDKGVLNQYVDKSWASKEALDEFNPRKKLCYEVVGVSISYSIFFGALYLGWSESLLDWVNIIALILVAFIWLGITTTIAVSIPASYRARKIIYKILNAKKK